MAKLGAAYSGIGMTSQRTRSRMVERLREKGIRNERVLAAMSEIPRHIFIEPALESRAYDDVSLPLGHGQTISQPYIVARMTELLLTAPKSPNKILEIGTGCGYQTAVLAHIFGEVYSVERIAALQERARQTIKTLGLNTRVRLSHHDGHHGLVEAAPFDGIIVTAAAAEIPKALIEQLGPQGRLIIPVGQEQQHLWSVDKLENDIQSAQLDAVRFVPLLSGRG